MLKLKNVISSGSGFNKTLHSCPSYSFSFAAKIKQKLYQRIFKPIIDFTVAFTGFIILFPVFILVMIVLFIANRGNPFFLQVRPGKNERLFKIVKFKTMTDAKDANGCLLPDSQRLTMVGKIIRKTSLDEIPQLLNVIKGDMSIVGPRPLLPEYLQHFNDFQKQRHRVRPGITGLAAVNGRNAISWKKKFEYDVMYVRNVSFSMDLKILWKTIVKVIKSEGVNSQNMATTEPYNGTN